MLSLVIQAGYEGGDIAEFLLLQWSPMPTENKLQHRSPLSEALCI